MKSKENILNSVDPIADDETKKIANDLTDFEAEKFANRIKKDIKSQESATPITTISKLRRYGDRLSYKLRFTVELSSSINLN